MLETRETTKKLYKKVHSKPLYIKQNGIFLKERNKKGENKHKTTNKKQSWALAYQYLHLK